MPNEKLFFTHIREAIQMFKGEAKESQPDDCAHCWHQYGPASGGINSDGSGHASGTNRCCHCGETQKYDHRTPPRALVQHGRFYHDIQNAPR